MPSSNLSKIKKHERIPGSSRKILPGERRPTPPPQYRFLPKTRKPENSTEINNQPKKSSKPIKSYNEWLSRRYIDEYDKIHKKIVDLGNGDFYVHYE